MLAIMDTKKTDSFYWVEWMVKEREKQDMSQAELARKSGLSRTAISDYERRQRPYPEMDALVRISLALGYPADHLPRIVGLLPAQNGISEEIRQIAHEVEKLNKQDQDEVLAFIRMKQNLRKKQ